MQLDSDLCCGRTKLTITSASRHTLSKTDLSRLSYILLRVYLGFVFQNNIAFTHGNEMRLKSQSKYLENSWELESPAQLELRS